MNKIIHTHHNEILNQNTIILIFYSNKTWDIGIKSKRSSQFQVFENKMITQRLIQTLS